MLVGAVLIIVSDPDGAGHLQLHHRPPGGRAQRQLDRGQRGVREPVQGRGLRPGRVSASPPRRARSRRRSPTPRRWSSPACRWRSPSAAACSTSAPRARRQSASILAAARRLRAAAAARGAPAGGAARRRARRCDLGFIPGILKARAGAHEVINTIMLNYVAVYFLSWIIVQNGVQNPSRSDAISKPVDVLRPTAPAARRQPAGARRHPARGAGHLVRRLAAQPLDARLRAARGRRQPGRRPDRRHQRHARRTCW